MDSFEITEEILAKAETVWKILADVERWNEWTPSVQKIVPVGDVSMGLGAKYRVTQPKLAPMVYKVTVFEPGKNFTWQAETPGIRIIGEHWILPSSKERHVQLKLVLRQEGFLSPLIHLFFGKLTRQYVTMEAQSLRGRAETLK